MVDYSVIGKRIKSARTKHGITQEKLAEELNISSEYVSRVENAKAKPNLEMLVKIADILHTDAASFISGSSVNSSVYLSQELQECLESCTPQKIKAILEISHTICNL